MRLKRGEFESFIDYPAHDEFLYMRWGQRWIKVRVIKSNRGTIRVASNILPGGEENIPVHKLWRKAEST